jgi:hypothetical protein
MPQMTTVPILEDVDRVPGRPEITAWRRAARLHQHLWREQHGWPVGAQRRPARLGGGTRSIGSLVDDEVAREKGTNFLHPSALDAAIERVSHPQPFQTLDESALFADLLNPTALACNLFGELWADGALAVSALERWFRDAAGRDERCTVQFDWSPGRRNRRWIDDTTAFDAAFHLSSGSGNRLIGVSLKYHDYPNAQPVVTDSDRRLVRRAGDRLLEVTERAQLFRGTDWLDQVFGTDLERVWRAHALAQSCVQADADTVSALFVLVAPSGNAAWADAAERYGRLLTTKARSTFAFRTLDEMVDHAATVLPYADDIRARYLDVSVATRVAMSPVRRAGGQQLYMIGEVDGLPAVKFSVSDRPRSRMSDISTGNPRELELLHIDAIANARWVEYQLAAVLAPWRLDTNPEWYDVRHLVVGGDWQEFVERALTGLLPGAGPSPVPPGVPGHELLHVDGKVKAFKPVCTCGWRGPSGTIRESLGEFIAHRDALDTPIPADASSIDLATT